MENKEMEDRVSIIVPAHNAGRYIDKCIKSIVDQTYKNLEIIIVENGSTDDTLKICSELAEKYKAIRVVSSSDSGVSRARNTGIRLSTGKYIAFADADDWLDETIIECAVRRFKNNYLNIWGHVLCYKDKSVPESPVRLQQCTKNQLIANTISSLPPDYLADPYLGSCWGKLFEADIIRSHDICFPEDMTLGEDTIFALRYMQYIKGVNIISESGYNYNMTDNSSITHSLHSDVYEQYERKLSCIYQVIDNLSITDDNDINAAVVNFSWVTFRIISFNFIREALSRKIPLRKITDEPFRWLDTHRDVLTRTVSDRKRIERSIYPMYSMMRKKRPYTVIYMYYFISECCRKIMRMRRN